MLILQLVSLDNDQIAQVQSFGEKEAFSNSVSNDDFWHGSPSIQLSFVKNQESTQSIFEYSQLFFDTSSKLSFSFQKKSKLSISIIQYLSDFIYRLIFPFHSHW